MSNGGVLALSAIPAFVFGVALGNVVRCVPLDAQGYFHLPLFNILNWYALLIGVFALFVLAHHGAEFLAWRTDGPLFPPARLRARLLFGPLEAGRAHRRGTCAR